MLIFSPLCPGPAWTHVTAPLRVCVRALGVGHGAAEPGEPAANGLSRQRAPSLGPPLPAGGEEAHGGRVALDPGSPDIRFINHTSMYMCAHRKSLSLSSGES